MIKRHDSIVVQAVSKLLVPFIELFAIYVLFHGHYSPGGGFQAGVLLASAIILDILVGTKRELKQYSISREFMLAALGVGIFLMVGVYAIFHGKFFFDYSALDFLGKEPYDRRYWAILIAEIGVTIVVAMSIIIIFNVLAFLPQKKGVENS